MREEKTCRNLLLWPPPAQPPQTAATSVLGGSWEGAKRIPRS